MNSFSFKLRLNEEILFFKVLWKYYRHTAAYSLFLFSKLINLYNQRYFRNGTIFEEFVWFIIFYIFKNFSSWMVKSCLFQFRNTFIIRSDSFFD